MRITNAGPLNQLWNAIGFLGALIFSVATLSEDSIASTTYFISPSGSDTNSGMAQSMPWKTFAQAIANMACGDDLVLLDGTYTIPSAGALVITGQVCSPGSPFKVKTLNERRAWLKGDGSTEVVKIASSAYIVLQGLRVTSADNNTPAGNPVNVLVQDSNHITIQRFLVSHNNRYRNTALLRLGNTTDSLVEETELYYFHRHGIAFSSSNNNVGRRNYCNGRGYPDIPGGYVSGGSAGADACFAEYPGSNNIYENNISDNNNDGQAYDIEALSTNAVGSKYYGNISLGDYFGFLFKARTESLTHPLSTHIKDGVVINPVSVGVYLRGPQGVQVDNVTVFGSTSNSGLVADTLFPDTHSVFGSNLLTFNNTAGTGALVANQNTWSFNYGNTYGNRLALSPSSSPNWQHVTTTNPSIGTCRAWIPDSSPLKRAGSNGADIGATVLYRYEKGVLTNIPLWEPATGRFPCGATVPGMNDVAGSSCFDVHQRLNVNTNGCYFPASYSQARDTTPPMAPQHVSVQ